jgi:predicted PurR-regulated permease PerM
MNPPPTPLPRPLTSGGDAALRIIAVAAVLAILYLGRGVLVPIALAIVLSFVLLPLVHGLRRIGLGQTFSVLAAVLCAALGVIAIAVVIGSQLVRMSTNLPQYERRIEHKINLLRTTTVRRAQALIGLAEHREIPTAAPLPVPASGTEPSVASENPPPPAAPAPASGAMEFVQRLLASVWVPLETAGTVLVVLIFVLLEHEALRDRVIRVAGGGADIRGTTNLINDAGARLSRFFGSQFAVNVVVGAVLWLGLALFGLRHALLWATLATVLRFVPYIGIWIAALFAIVFAAAVDPGWSLATLTAALFVVVELLAGQLVEPRLFGHATGLSPLSVVLAAIFWSWLWGPVGLILSTPLTLCLLVLGRNTQALQLLDVMLGDTPALTMPQRLYQRALSGDSADILATARVFLKRNSLAVYCDKVLMPAIYLAGLDFMSGTIDHEQQVRVRGTMTTVITSLGQERPTPVRRQRRSTVLETATLGRRLREQRERQYGRWQGPIDVPPGSVTLCIGLGTAPDELATEILVRILRAQHIDARHILAEELPKTAPEGATPDGVLLVYVVSAFRSEDRLHGADVAREVRAHFPQAWLCAVLLPGLLAEKPQPVEAVGEAPIDQSVNSLADAEALALERYAKRAAV